MDYKEKAIEVSGKIACISGRCAMCGQLREVHPHHVVHRMYGNTCALVKNQFPMCAVCHSDVHREEMRFHAFLEQNHPGLYQELWEIARPVCQIDFELLYMQLLEEYYDLLKEKHGQNTAHKTT